MVGLGALMAALGYVVFQTPHNLAAGGVSGLGIIVNHYTGFSVGTFYLVVNVPLFIWGFFSLGRWSFLWSSTVAVAVFSMASDLLAWRLPEVLDSWPITNDALLSAIYAGALYGLGTGIIYRYGGTIGGSSISARIIYNKTGFPLSQSYLFTDLAVVLASGLVFNWETALLAAMTLMLCGIFSNYALEGTSQVRTLMIITEKPDPIRLALMHELQRGVTHWEVTGGYSGTVRTMLYFTVLRSRVYDVKHIVSRLDPDAFMVVGLAHQAWGGYNAPKLEDRE
jgi:uncharacterized membrane-anchored protein YitT (DUF2179 family)